MNPDREFDTLLRQLRSARDLTQEALAEAVGCASQTVRSFEGGRRRPSREMAARLADIFDLSGDERDRFVRLARVPYAAPAVRAAAVHADAPAPTAPARHLGTPQLRPADGLIGRHHEQQRLRRALLDDRQRLVTLLGPGGVGKTCLALQTATNLEDQFAATAFVALVSVSDMTGVVAACAVAVGCPLSGVLDTQAALLTFLRDRTLLLVLDNLEHLLTPEQGDSMADFLSTILHTAPGVALLVTSRERLRLQAEWVVEIGGLGVPADDQPTSIAHADAVLLFVERARRVTGDFALGPHNERAVAQICRRLDGLPLALELAAAQVSFLPPAALLARLDQALPLLEGGARDLPARQRTMRATIGWSYNLLAGEERHLFERLGVLVGSFSLPAAEAVGARNGIAPLSLLGLLRRLVDRSLVVRDDPAGDDVRYRLLEPVRQYALEQLEAQRDAAIDARQRHAAYFAVLAEQLGPALRVPQAAAAFSRVLAQIEREYPNIRAAITWALSSKQMNIVAQMGWALFTFWWYRSQQREPRGWMEAMLLEGEHLALQTRARALLALLATLYGGEASRSLTVGHAAQALFEQNRDTYSQAHTLIYIGLAWLRDGNFVQAVDALQRAHELGRRVDDTWLTTEAATILGLALAYAGDYVQATQYLEDGITTASANHDTWNMLLSLFNRALLAQVEGDVQRVAHFCRTWLALSPDVVIVNGSAVAYCLESLAVDAATKDEQVRASRLFGAVDALREIAGTFILLQSHTQYDHTVEALRQQLAAPHLATAWAEGRAMNVTEAVAYALEASNVQHT